MERKLEYYHNRKLLNGESICTPANKDLIEKLKEHDKISGTGEVLDYHCICKNWDTSSIISYQDHLLNALGLVDVWESSNDSD